MTERLPSPSEVTNQVGTLSRSPWLEFSFRDMKRWYGERPLVCIVFALSVLSLLHNQASWEPSEGHPAAAGNYLSEE